jgi:hypothetical protein
MLVEFMDLDAEVLVAHGNRLEGQLGRRGWGGELVCTPTEGCRAGHQLWQSELSELSTQGIWSGHHQGVQLIGCLCAAFDCRLTSHS